MTALWQDWKWRINLKIHHTLPLERSFSFNSFLYFSRLKFMSLQTGGLALLWTYIKFKKGKQEVEPHGRHNGRDQKRFLLLSVEWGFCRLLLTFLIENTHHHLYLFTKFHLKQNENDTRCIYNQPKLNKSQGKHEKLKLFHKYKDFPLKQGSTCSDPVFSGFRLIVSSSIDHRYSERIKWS